MTKRRDRGLFISDTQEPYGDDEAIAFCKRVQKEFDIPSANTWHVGDEIDAYHGGRWPKDPDFPLTPTQELELCKERFKAWGKAFPQMQICDSNHGARWANRAKDALIPSIMTRSYPEVLEAPRGWKWASKWVIPWKHRVLVFHGIRYESIGGGRQACLDKGMNVVFGHAPTTAGISHVVTCTMSRWSMNVGCLHKLDHPAFSYASENKYKAFRGVGVVLDSGRYPILVPFGSL